MIKQEKWFSFYIDLVKRPRWYVHLYEENPKLAYYMRSVDNWWLGEIKRAERSWRRDRQKLKEEISKFAKQTPEYATKKRLEYLDQREIEATGKELGAIRAEKEGRGITDAMIERAKEYPIGDIIEVNNAHFAICPFHDDQNASAYCKNNFLHCFACNTTESVIGVYMKVNNCSFVEAVRSLNI